jgi:SAM-dependent methyltransferase
MKGEQQRQVYLAKRAKVSEQLGKREVFSVADAWPLYAGTQNIRRYFYINNLLLRVKDVPGHIAEFGCWRGATTSLMAKVLEIIAPMQQKVVHGFDSFEGFDKAIQKAKGLRSGYKGNQVELELLLELHGLSDAVELHVGDICETVPMLMIDRPELRLSFSYIDCDVYEPCVEALRFTHERLSSGGLIVFDEWNDPAWPGETQAAEEFLSMYGDCYRREATPIQQPSLVLVRK